MGVEIALESLFDAIHRRGLAENTRAAYERTWRRLLAFAQSEDGVEGLTPELALRFWDHYTGRVKAPTQLQMRAAIDFAYREWGLPNPFAEIPRPRHDIEQTPIRYLLAHQVAALLGTMGSEATYYGTMAHTIAVTMFFTASRFAEIAGLDRGEVQMSAAGEPMAVRVRQKGGRHRDKPLPGTAAETLAGWVRLLDAVKGARILSKGGLEFARSTRLFPAMGGRPYSNDAFNRRLASACRRAGVPEISSHGLRHSAATIALNDRRRSIREVQELLGHRSINTTARYTHVMGESLREVAEGMARAVGMGGAE